MKEERLPGERGLWVLCPRREGSGKSIDLVPRRWPQTRINVQACQKKERNPARKESIALTVTSGKNSGDTLLGKGTPMACSEEGKGGCLNPPRKTEPSRKKEKGGRSGEWIDGESRSDPCPDD